MQLYLSVSRIKVILVLSLIALGAGSYAYNQYLIESIQEREGSDVQLWAKAIEFNSQPFHEQVITNLNRSLRILSIIPEVPDSVIRMIEEVERVKSSFDFVTENLVLGDRFRVPSIVVNEEGEILFASLLSDEDLDRNLIEVFGAMHPPIEIQIGDGRMRQTQYVYYGDSQTVQYLKFFPYFQIGLLALLLGIGYVTYRSITRSEQSNLWVGMAKEAAHQLGTPISSLFGWVQLLKDHSPEDEETAAIIHEIESDIKRLKGVAERFNKIGSEPELKEVRLEPMVDQVIHYMESRLPRLGRQVEVKKSVSTRARVRVNPELFHWALENLIKNAIDAIREHEDGAFVAIRAHQIENEVCIDIQDSGGGIERKYLNDVFKPGFSTKKRGWGLGLSLTRRIIEDYHKGRIEVYHSEPGKGTTMRITLKAIQESMEPVKRRFQLTKPLFRA